MHHAALDRAGPHDRDFDDEIVEARGLETAAASTAARAIRSGTRRSCPRAGTSRRPPGPPPECPASALLTPRNCEIIVSARRMAESMPSARQSTLSRPIASRSSLSHWMTVRSFIEAFSTGTMRSSRPRAITKPPTCCDRWRGKPMSSPVSVDEPRDQRIVRDRSRFADARGIDRAAVPPGEDAGQAGRPARGRGPAPCPRRARRSSADT